MLNSIVSVVMPAFNEEEIISSSIKTTCNVLEKGQMNYELIVVNDGSHDQTFETAWKEAAKHNGHVKVVGYNPPNNGKGYALKYGTAYAKGDYVLFLDSDLEIDPSNLSKYLKVVEGADLVIASKRHPDSKVDEPLTRRIMSFCFHMFVRLLTGVNVSDTQAGLKGFRAESLKKILPLLSVKKYAFDVELLVVAKLHKMKVVELPVAISLKAGFKVGNIARMFVDTLGIAYRLRVLHWYQRNINNQSPKHTHIIQW
ncbi:MAG: hypothetical protein QG670_2054 [Thermoproteota archaeon]|nr:hypothetical protein [Thermoproteota archaeon]